jgi:hypothetical protein
LPQVTMRMATAMTHPYRPRQHRRVVMAFPSQL